MTEAPQNLSLSLVLLALVGLLAYDGQPSSPPVRGTAPTSDVLTHSPLAQCTPGQRPRGGQNRLRVATWNIQAARSASLDDIAAELQAMQADVMALQEVDLRARRTGFTDQPQALAKALAAHYVFAASIKWDGGDYGLALLSRWPLVEVRRHRLELAEYGEPRIVLEVTVCARGRPLRLFNHHAAVGRRSREIGLAQLRALVVPHAGSGVVVLGDLNDFPTAPGVKALLDAGLLDAGAEENASTAGGGRIDYVLVDTPLASRLRSTKLWPTKKSDHHALIAEFEW